MFGEAGWSELSGPIIEVAREDCFWVSLSFGCFGAEVVALERHMGCPGEQVHCCYEPTRPSYSCTGSHVGRPHHLRMNTPLPSSYFDDFPLFFT